MKNIALKRIPFHCTLNKFQHQTHVLPLHAANQNLLACNCKSRTNSMAKCIL